MKRQARPAVLVTGAARRLGRAMALGLAEDGFDIAIHYHSSSGEAMDLARLICSMGVDAELFPCDLADAEATGAMFAAVCRRFPRLSVLINSASIFSPSEMGGDALDAWEANQRLHIRAPWILSSQFVERIGRGLVINIIDSAVVRDCTEYAAYLLSKKGLSEMTRMAAVAFAPKVRVNAVAPGLILAPEGQDAASCEQKALQIPLQRQGSPEDVVHATRFLIAATYITGQTIFVDGGKHLHKK